MLRVLQRRNRGLVLLAMGFVVVFVVLGGRSTKDKTSLRSGSATKINVDNRCTSAAESLVSAGINLLALDFDLTIIDQHTGGRWKGTSNKLSKCVRPAFICLLNAAMDRGIQVAVVTFSEQEELISNVMKRIFPESRIPVRGWLDKEGGKQKHMEKATQDIMSQIQEGMIISKETTLLIDDDERNIKIARDNSYQAIAFNPDNPWGLLETIKIRMW